MWRDAETDPAPNDRNLKIFYYPATADAHGRNRLGEYYKIDYTSAIPRKPTHWMYLPSPPETTE